MSVNYVELKVSELRDECKARNLDTSGLKVHLVERLSKYDKDHLMKNLNNSKTPITTNNQNNTTEIKEISTVIEKSCNENINESNIVLTDSSNNIETNIIKGKDDDYTIAQKSLTKTLEREASPTKDAAKVDLFNLASIEDENWEDRTDVHLDYYNSNMNMVIYDDGFSASPLYEDGFEYMCGAVKANYGFKSGKVFYEVNKIKKIKADLNIDAGEANFIRVGWSVDSEFLTLGEKNLSFAYDGSGKKICDGIITDYGINIEEGSVIGCFLEYNHNRFLISFSVNGVNQGIAFDLPSEDLKDLILIPHIYVKNISFEVNFGKKIIFSPKKISEGSEQSDIDTEWTIVGKVDLNKRIRNLKPPTSKSECEVLMMCGLPSCGKTYWTEKHMINHPDKRYNLLSVNTVLEQMKVINLRRKVSSSVWDSFISYASNCLNKLMKIAVSRKRNFILDQTNVYPSAQRRRMKPFEEFIRKAIIIVPTDDEYQRRMNQVIQEEGKDVPESAVLQLKENFVIPEENSDLFNEIIFIELQRLEAEELIRKYSEEAKNLKNKDSNVDNNSKRKQLVEEDEEEEDEEDDDERYGKWGVSSNEDNNEPSAPKKSRWNDQVENRKRSRSKEKYDRNSSEKLPRKNDYKGGFCFSREASDSGRSGRSNDNNSKYEDRYGGNKSRDQRGERFTNRSSELSDRRSGYNNDRRSNFENRDESRFGGRNFGSGGGAVTGGNRDSRARDRGNDSRGGGSAAFDRNRSRGYNNRRSSGGNSYNYDGDSRTKFSQPPGFGNREGYNNNSSGFQNQDRNNRFPDRGDFRGRGRGRGGSVSGNQGSGFGKDSSFNDRRNVGDSREYNNYSEYDSFNNSNRQSNNKPWQQDYKNNTVNENSRRGGPSENDNTSNFNRINHMSTGGFDQQQYAAGRGAIGGNVMNNPRIGGGDSIGKLSHNQYSDRKPIRGAGHTNRGATATNRFAASFMDSGASVDDYSYTSSKSYESMSIPKFDSKSSNPPDIIATGPPGGGYKEQNRTGGSSALSYSNNSRGRYNKFDDGHKSAQNMGRNYGGGMSSAPIGDSGSNQKDHNYNSQYNQNQYYNYYTSTNYDKDQSSNMSSTYQPAHQQSSGAWSGNVGTGSHAHFSYSSTSNQMGRDGTSYQSLTNSQNSSSGVGGGSNYPPFSSYQGSNTASGNESYQSSNQMSGPGSAGIYHSSNSAGGTGGYQSYQAASNQMSGGSGGVYHQTNQTSYPINSYSTGSGDQTGYQSTNQSISATSGNVNSYTNPYNAIYENSYFGSGYHGQNTNSCSGQSLTGSYGDCSKVSSSTERSQQATGSAPGQHVSSSSNQAVPPAWGTGYGDYSQYYGQQYGQK